MLKNFLLLNIFVEIVNLFYSEFFEQHLFEKYIFVTLYI